MYLGGAQTVRILVKAVYIVLLARLLGPELFGLYNYGLSWYLAFMSLTFLGFDLILGKEINQRGDKSDVFVASALRLQLYASTAASALSLLISLSVEEQSLSLVLGLFSLALLGRSVSAWASFVFTARESSNRVFWIESTCRICEAAIGTVVLLLGGGLLEVVVVHALFWWTQAVWSLSELSVMRLLRIPCNIKDLVFYLGGAPIILGVAGVAQVWLAQGPLLLFRLLGGHPVSLGQVALAFQIFALLAGTSWAVCRAVLPELSKSVRERRSGDIQFVTVFGQLTITVAGMMTSVTYVLAAPLLEFLVGREYAAAGVYAPYVVALSAAYTLAVGGHQILASHGDYKQILVGTVAGAVVLSGTMILIWQWSPQLAPFWSLGAGLFVWLILIGRYVFARTHFSVSRVILLPLAISISGLIIARLLLPFSAILVLAAIAVWFSIWAWKANPLKLLSIESNKL